MCVTVEDESGPQQGKYSICSVRVKAVPLLHRLVPIQVTSRSSVPIAAALLQSLFEERIMGQNYGLILLKTWFLWAESASYVFELMFCLSAELAIVAFHCYTIDGHEIQVIYREVLHGMGVKSFVEPVLQCWCHLVMPSDVVIAVYGEHHWLSIGSGCVVQQTISLISRITMISWN